MNNSSKQLNPGNFEPPSSKRSWRFQIQPLLILSLFIAALVLTLVYFLFTSTSVLIRTTPETANITINEFHIPVGERFILRTGSAEIELQAEGYLTENHKLEISKEGTAEFEFELSLQPGNLQVEVSPEIETEVYLDDQLLGLAPGLIEMIPAGLQTLRFDAPLYRAVDYELEIIGRGETQTLEIPLEPAFAMVSLNSEPENASIIIDGKGVATTPAEFALEEGYRTIILELEGYKQQSIGLQVEAGVNLSENALLQENDAKLEISTTPNGAAVTIDGVYLGQTPLIAEVEPGSRNLELFLTGYKPFSQFLSLSSGEQKTIQPSLVSETTEVQFSIAPSDAEIYIDGELTGSGSKTIELQTQKVRISVRKPGYASWESELIPSIGSRQVVSVQLLTTEEASWANIPNQYQAKNGYPLKLFRDAGNVEMGSPRREAGRRANEYEHTVELSRAFYAGLYEVSNAQYRQYDPNYSSGNFEGHSLDLHDQPVTGVNWQQAALFCNWLSEQEGLSPFYTIERGFVSGADANSTGYRLLTEAEWTWLARSGSPTRSLYPWGDSEFPTTKFGNIADDRISDKIGFTLEGFDDGCPVSAATGEFSSNNNGLFDLEGNVSEWVHDWYQAAPSDNSDQQIDSLGPEIGEFHVIRGASWAKGYLPQLRLAYRDYDAEGRNDVGFRIGRYAK